MTLTEHENSNVNEPQTSGSLTIGATTYQWETIWDEYSGGGWQHSGITVLQDGSVVFAHPEGKSLVCVRRCGTVTEISTELTEMHCLVSTHLDGEEILWVADNGTRYCEGKPEYQVEAHAGRVVALSIAGTIRQELLCPVLPAYRDSGWRPTTVAVDGVTGDIWVGDGYGASLVHCFDAQGQLRFTLTGAESGVAFSSPHGIYLRGTNGEQELYVADRGNKRLVVYGLDGAFQRIVGAAVLNSPSSLVEVNGTLQVTELSGSIAVFEGDDFVGRAGASTRSIDDDAWPNQRDAGGNVVKAPVRPGTFNSPHGITVYQGQILLTEWMIGGRVTLLSPVS